MLGRLLIALCVGGCWWVLAHDDTRDGLMEFLRDLSDRLMMLALRATSGFASEVAPHVLEEERERRLRWR